MRYLKLLLLLLVLAGAYLALQAIQGGVGTLQVYSGAATVLRGDQTLAATTGLALQKADTVTTGADSRVAIVLRDNSVVRLEASSTIRLAEIVYAGSQIQSATLELETGRAWSRVEPLSAGGSFQVETPTAVASVRGTRFGVDALIDRSRVYVAEDSVLTALKSDAANEKIVAERNLFDLGTGNLAADFAVGPAPASPEFLADEWLAFNEAEDTRIEDEFEGETTGDDVVAITITAEATTLRVGETTNLRVVVRFADGREDDVTEEVTWQQSNPIGRFDGRRFTARSIGQTVVSVTSEDIRSNDVTLTVTD